MSSKIGWKSFSKKWRKAGPFRRVGRKIGPMSESLHNPIQTLHENWYWKWLSRTAWGFSCCQMWALCWLKIPARVKVASSVQITIRGKKASFVVCCKNHSENSLLRGRSSGNKFWTLCRWYGWRPSAFKVLFTVLCVYPNCKEHIRVLLEGVSSKCSKICSVLLSFWRGAKIPSARDRNEVDPVSLRRWKVQENTDLSGNLLRGIYERTQFLQRVHCHYSTRKQTQYPRIQLQCKYLAWIWLKIRTNALKMHYNSN